MERVDYLMRMAEACRKGAADVLNATPASDLPRRFLALAEECELEAEAAALGAVDAWAAGRA
jgi:hypothetical protein